MEADDCGGTFPTSFETEGTRARNYDYRKCLFKLTLDDVVKSVLLFGFFGLIVDNT